MYCAVHELIHCNFLVNNYYNINKTCKLPFTQQTEVDTIHSTDTEVDTIQNTFQEKVRLVQTFSKLKQNKTEDEWKL
jgi:hypothetical protein